MDKLILKINVDGLQQGLKKGSEVAIEVDKDGTPFEKFWLDRIKDSKIDNCVTIMKTEKTNKK